MTMVELVVEMVTDLLSTCDKDQIDKSDTGDGYITYYLHSNEENPLDLFSFFKFKNTEVGMSAKHNGKYIHTEKAPYPVPLRLLHYKVEEKYNELNKE